MLEIQDHYFHLAKKDGYVARSAYKLKEIDEKFKLFGRGVCSVIDIGCAPGSWLQYASRVIMKNEAIRNKNKKGDGILEDGKYTSLLIGFDLKKVDLNLPYTSTFVQDITDQQAVKKIINQQLLSTSKVDVIISDMAPDTVGNKGTDALRASYLVMETMRMYETLLKKDGKFAIKVFMGPGFEELVQYCRTVRGVSHIKIFKPKACRKESKETYIVKI